MKVSKVMYSRRGLLGTPFFIVPLHKATKGHSGKNWEIQFLSTSHRVN